MIGFIVFLLTKTFNWYFNYLTKEEKQEKIGKIIKFFSWEFLLGFSPIRNKILKKGNERYRTAALELEDLKRKLVGYIDNLLLSNIPYEGDYIQELIK